jgi:Sulfotransferase family
MERLPDFIIIGAMKCATSTLYEQLVQQSGIYMSTPKEPKFFSDDPHWNKGIQWYCSLFQDADPQDICGEASTHYTKLPDYPETVSRMRQHLPEVKLIYMMRHPIDRLVSQYLHELTKRTMKVSIDQAVQDYPRLTAYSLYSKQLQPYLETYGYRHVLPVFLERLMANPRAELQRICDFIGYRGTPLWHSEVHQVNTSSERLKASKIRDAIVWHPTVTWMRRRFVPQAWRDWIKSFWQVKQRPVLSVATGTRLQVQFDEDLSRLGAWLQVDLNCANFASVVVSQRSLDWAAQNEAAEPTKPLS